MSQGCSLGLLPSIVPKLDTIALDMDSHLGKKYELVKKFIYKDPNLSRFDLVKTYLNCIEIYT